MNIVAPRQQLLNLFESCRACVAKKSGMTILESVLIQAEAQTGGGVLRVSGTDLYLGLTGTIAAEVTEAGAAAADAGALIDRIKAMPDGPVELATRKTGLLDVNAPGSKRKFSMPASDASEFPTLPKPNGEAAILLPAAALDRLITKTIFAVSLDTTRPHVNSLLLRFDGSTLVAAATDGHRLAKVVQELEKEAPEDAWLLPHAGLGPIRSLLSEAPKKRGEDAKPPTVSIRKSKATLFFELGDKMLSIKLVDAQFPPFEQVIPRRDGAALKVPREGLMGVVKAVAVASDKTNGVRLEFTGTKLVATVSSAEAGDACDEVIVDGADAPKVKVGLSARYILDVLGAIETENVSMSMPAELDPIVLTPEGDASSMVMVIMPMRI